MSETMRRLPAQKRSREKVEQILAAAEKLLIDVGYAAAVETPQPLLETAGVSRGAFYAYFTNPENVMETLALGYMDEARATADALAVRDYASVTEVAEVFCETYRIYYTRPQTRELWLQGHLTPGAISADQQTNLYLAGRLETALRNIDANSEALELHHCAVAIETMDYLLRFALRHEPLGDPLLVGEAMVAVASYLSNYVRQSA